MNWSIAQRHLFDIARETHTGKRVRVTKIDALDRETEIVAEEQVKAVLEYLHGTRDSGAWRGPVNLVLSGDTPGASLTGLQFYAGTNSGTNLTARAWKALKELSGGQPGALTIWLSDARRLSVNEQERLVNILTDVARHLKLTLHLVFITGNVWRKDGLKAADFSGRLHADCYTLKKAGLVNAEEEPEERSDRKMVSAG